MINFLTTNIIQGSTTVIMYKKTTCQCQIKFITDKYLHMYKTLQLFTNTLNLIQTYLQTSKLLKTHMYRQKVIKNANHIKAWIKLQLFIQLFIVH